MDLIYTDHPAITIASNTFINVKNVIQYEDTPLIEIKKMESAGFSTRLTVFHSDGAKIAVVKGSQIYPTNDGKKASLKMRNEANLTACELEGKTIMELRRDGATALHGWAELYAPEGVFIKMNDTLMAANRSDGTDIKVGGMSYKGVTISDVDIGIHVTKEKINLGGRSKHGW